MSASRSSSGGDSPPSGLGSGASTSSQPAGGSRPSTCRRSSPSSPLPSCRRSPPVVAAAGREAERSEREQDEQACERASVAELSEGPRRPCGRVPVRSRPCTPSPAAASTVSSASARRAARARALRRRVRCASRRLCGQPRRRRGRTTSAAGPSPSGRHSTQHGHLDLDDQLARLERRQPRSSSLGRRYSSASSSSRRSVRRRAPSASSAAAGSDGCADAQQLVAEERVLAVLALPRVAAVAAVQVARELQPPVPAARGLEQVAADRPCRAELRRRGEPAGLAQRVRDLRARPRARRAWCRRRREADVRPM